MTRSNGVSDVRLSEIVVEAKNGFAIGERAPDGVVQLRMNNVGTSGELDFSDATRVPATKDQLRNYVLQFGDVLFNNTNSPALVGKSAHFRGFSEPVLFSNHFTRLRFDSDRADPGFMARWLTRKQQSRFFENRCNQWVNQASFGREMLLELSVPLPPLSDQQRIAAILDKADTIRRKRQEASNAFDELPLATFYQVFADYLDPDQMDRKLTQVAEVVSGVAKGRRLVGDAIREVPYLRVANVQAGFLDLSEIKTIPAKQSEIDALALETGDVVMTEGGDHDKLGRGALWEHDIEDCIHQNHVFRVRANRDHILPTFFVHYLQTAVAKHYFLRCAKKTTNLASINMTQLRALPVPEVPLKLQERFERELGSVDASVDHQSQAQVASDELFNSLMQRAFRGEL